MCRKFYYETVNYSTLRKVKSREVQTSHCTFFAINLVNSLVGDKVAAAGLAHALGLGFESPALALGFGAPVAAW